MSFTRIGFPKHIRETCFLWGPRQTGKSTLLKTLFPKAQRYDLLLANEYQRLLLRPEIIREECASLGILGSNQKAPIVIDEIQKLPILLDEVHWMIENWGLYFILCGSSARKLKRGHGNLLGGRALRYELHPLVSAEIPDFSLNRALNQGLLPRHYLSENPERRLHAYVGDYLREEIFAEALCRNIQAFSRFLEVAALSNGEMVQYQNIAMECGVSAPTVKEYYQILIDTLLGRFLPSYRKKNKRRVIGASKFYFFDVGVLASLTRRKKVEPRTELFGKAFEHFLFLEISAHSDYSGKFYPLTYWRTASGFEVDFILGDHEIAIEAKATQQVQEGHLKGLRAFQEEFKPRRSIVVSLDPNPRKLSSGIEVIPWKVFLSNLWAGKIM